MGANAPSAAAAKAMAAHGKGFRVLPFGRGGSGGRAQPTAGSEQIATSPTPRAAGSHHSSSAAGPGGVDRELAAIHAHGLRLEDSGGGVASSSSGVPVSEYWAAVRDLIYSREMTVGLPDALFDPLFHFASQQMMAVHLPAFRRSPEYAVALGLAAARLPILRYSVGAGGLTPPLGFNVTPESFDRLGCIGTGSYGAVYVWRHRDTGTCYATKCMNKKVLKHKQVRRKPSHSSVSYITSIVRCTVHPYRGPRASVFHCRGVALRVWL